MDQGTVRRLLSDELPYEYKLILNGFGNGTTMKTVRVVKAPHEYIQIQVCCFSFFDAFLVIPYGSYVLASTLVQSIAMLGHQY